MTDRERATTTLRCAPLRHRFMRSACPRDHVRRAPVGALLLGAALLGLTACNSESAVFQCEAADECAGGTCQPSGYCSFPDPSCPSGQVYGTLAPAWLAERCVPVEEHADDSSGSGGGGDEGDSDSETSPGESTTGEEPSGTSTTTDASETSGTESSPGTTLVSGSSDATTGDATTGDATTGDATTGDATTGDATTGEGTTGDATTGDPTANGEITGLTTATSTTELGTETTDGGEGTTTSPSTTGIAEGEGDPEAGEDSSSTTEPPIEWTCDFIDTFDGTTFDSHWARVGDFPSASQLTGTGQLEMHVDTVNTGATVMTAPLNPRAEEFYVALELATVDFSAAGFEQFVFGMYVPAQDDTYYNFEFQLYRGNLTATTVEGWPPTQHETAPFDLDTHRYIRLRIDGSGSDPGYYWETSVDGTEWDLFACLSESAAECEWPSGGFPAGGVFEPADATLHFWAGAYDLSQPPNADAFAVETFWSCGLDG